MRSIVHKKGRHRSRPFRIGFTRWLFQGFQFDHSAVYKILDEQKDWNKLTGLKKNYFRPMKTSMMAAWRYNPLDGMIEMTAYTHENGVRTIYTDIVKVEIGEPVIVSIDLVDGVVGINDKEYQTGMTSKNKWWLINSWFGGNKKAPHDITINRLF